MRRRPRTSGTFARPIFFGRRDEVILRLLLDTGVRVSELCGLTLEDVDLDRQVAYVMGRGSRPRAVPFGARTGQAIDRYLRMRALRRASDSRRTADPSQRSAPGMTVEDVPWSPNMRPVQITRFGGPQVLDIVDVPEPEGVPTGPCTTSRQPA